jgi:hypothetical protein
MVAAVAPEKNRNNIDQASAAARQAAAPSLFCFDFCPRATRVASAHVTGLSFRCFYLFLFSSSSLFVPEHSSTYLGTKGFFTAKVV